MCKHLRLNGFMPGYTVWVSHGEQERPREEVMRQHIDGNEDDGIRNMLDDLGQMPRSPPSEGEPEDPEETAKAFLDMMASSKKPLYEGAKISQLDSISQLLAVKAKFGWTRASFDELLAVLGNQLPEGNVLPQNMYESKKLMSALTMGYEKIDICPKNCLLFTKEYAKDDYCHKCKSSR